VPGIEARVGPCGEGAGQRKERNVPSEQEEVVVQEPGEYTLEVLRVSVHNSRLCRWPWKLAAAARTATTPALTLPLIDTSSAQYACADGHGRVYAPHRLPRPLCGL
jgi:hypothetical protein